MIGDSPEYRAKFREWAEAEARRRELTMAADEATIKASKLWAELCALKGRLMPEADQ